MPDTCKTDQLALVRDGRGSAGKGALGNSGAKNAESALKPVSLRGEILR
jgi:hypothetical protein